MEKRIKRKIGVLVVLGMFALIMLSPTAVAPDLDTDVNVEGSYSVNIDSDNDETDRIFRVTHDGTPGTELMRVQETGEVGIATTSPYTTLDVDGGFGAHIRVSVSTNDPALSTDHTILVDTTSRSITIDLPQASTATRQILVIKKISASNTVTIDGYSSETIDGATTKSWTTNYESYMIQCDGSNWYILASFP
jgi:hypothetical protein